MDAVHVVCPLTPVHDLWRLIDPDSFFDLSESLIIIPVNYSRLSLSRIPRDSLKHFEISVPRNIRVAEVRKSINRTTTFNK